MKRKLLVLTAVFSFALTPLAMAESVENLFYQGVNAHKQGNYTQAAKLFGKACHGGNAESCYNLGSLYAKGQNYTQAAKLFEQACNGGYANGCFNLGVYNFYGTGKPQQDLSAAKKYYGKACDLGNQNGCKLYESFNRSRFGF